MTGATIGSGRLAPGAIQKTEAEELPERGG